MLTDAELVDGVVAGYDDAFAQLYERHSLAAWRLGQTVTGNAEDAADAVSEAFARVLVAVRAGHLDNGGSFRSYLLTATRNAALDNIRKTGRSRPTEQDKLSELESTLPSPSDLLTNGEEAALVSEAFRNLPERWQSVLWLTEVEGIATKDAARRLGLSPNGTAQLAVRARTGLRERFLQAHLRNEAEPQCRTTVDRLGAYVGGGLSPRDLAKVDQHLAGCTSCEARRKELDDLGTCLRRAAVPAPLALAAALGTGGSSLLFGWGERAARVAEWAQQAWAQKAAAAAAAGALALGAGGAYVAGSGNDQAALPTPTTVVVATDQADSPPATDPGQVEESAPVPTSPEGASNPPASVQIAVPSDQADLVTVPDCLSSGLGVADVGGVRVEGGEQVLARESRSDDEPASEDHREVATLGSVFDHEGFDGEGEPSAEVELELELGELATRLALTGESLSEGGLQVGVNVGRRGGAPSPSGCHTGVGAGLDLNREALGSP